MTAPRTSTFNGDHKKAQNRLKDRDQSKVHTPVDTVALKQRARNDAESAKQVMKLRDIDEKALEVGNVDVENRAINMYEDRLQARLDTLDKARKGKIKAVP